MSLLYITKTFVNQEDCIKYLEKLRWQGVIYCPRCNGGTISRIKTVGKFECSKCRYQFSVTTRTIFHKTYIPLPKWFLMIYLLYSLDKRISIRLMSRDISLPYKTVWNMHNKIIKALGNNKFENWEEMLRFLILKKWIKEVKDGDYIEVYF